MTGPRMRGTAVAVLVAALGVAVGGRGEAQEDREDRACRLVLEPTTDSTESVSVEVQPDTYVTYVRGGLRWTCGSARMVADSAVRYEQQARLEMIGSVDYRDSVRTLLSDRVTYHERDDRIVARGDVRLTRRATGSTLEGPEMEFLRVSRGEARRTVATGRPLMTLRRDTASADTARPVRVRGDRIVLLGEDTVRAQGDVVVRRPDMEARSDSAVFRLEEEVGELHGSPEVVGRTWRLTGRTIRTRFEDGELREVVAEEEGHASGEDFELFASRIRARVAGRRIDRLWAYGEGRPVAFSPPYRLSADSLAFAFAGGEIDEVRALRDADAVEVGEEPPDDLRADVALTAGDRSWVTADTITLAFASPVAPGDSLPPPVGERARTPGRADSARPPGPAAPDSARAGALAPVDSLVDVSGAAPPGSPEDSARGGEGDAPEPPGAAGRGRDGEGRQIETLRAVGQARAYHLLEPDEPGGRPARHYQRGREIVIHFEAGEAARLEGRNAVGVHLDPTDGAAPAPGPDRRPPAPADSVPADTTPAAPPDTVSPTAETRGGDG